MFIFLHPIKFSVVKPIPIRFLRGTIPPPKTISITPQIEVFCLPLCIYANRQCDGSHAVLALAFPSATGLGQRSYEAKASGVKQAIRLGKAVPNSGNSAPRRA